MKQASKARNVLCEAFNAQQHKFEPKTERIKLWQQEGQNKLYTSFICVVAVLVAAVVVLGVGSGTIHVHRRAILDPSA